MALAVVGAIWAIVAQWQSFSAALFAMSPWAVLAALLASFAYVYVTMLSWRALLQGSGEAVPPSDASRIFFTSQVAKYLPGGVWNFVAAAEAGVAHKVSRRRSLIVLLMSMIVSILSGTVFTLLAIALGPSDVRTHYSWALVFLPIICVFLFPAVLNRLVSFGLRILKQDPLEKPLTWATLARTTAWSALAWITSGLQVWVIMVALGVEATPATFALATGGYALAWTIGFLVFFVPAGLGVREVVLAAVLAGYLTQGTALLVILLSRVLLTVADLGWGLGAYALHLMRGGFSDSGGHVKGGE